MVGAGGEIIKGNEKLRAQMNFAQSARNRNQPQVGESLAVACVVSPGETCGWDSNLIPRQALEQNRFLVAGAQKNKAQQESVAGKRVPRYVLVVSLGETCGCDSPLIPLLGKYASFFNFFEFCANKAL